MSERNLSLIDHLIDGADRVLRTLSPGSQSCTRATPAPSAEILASSEQLTDQEKRHAAGLMRVNHSGEVCAQALYQGQALTAKLPKVRDDMARAADEEIDHLAWCNKRLADLGSSPSLLNPLWYGLSFGIGASAGLISDKMSLGFVAATEHQVCEHLADHLERLPRNDLESRAIVEQMIIDEQSHADMALAAGGYEFPSPVKNLMTAVSKVMTSLSYRV